MIEQTKNIMVALKWSGALRTLDQRLHEAATLGWGHIETLSALVTDEKLYRDNQRITKRIRGRASELKPLSSVWILWLTEI